MKFQSAGSVLKYLELGATIEGCEAIVLQSLQIELGYGIGWYPSVGAWYYQKIDLMVTLFDG